MIYKVIKKHEFKVFINNLITENQVIGPRAVDKKTDGKVLYQFDEVDSYDELDLDYTVTYSSVKNYFLPYKEELSSFDFTDDDWEQKIEYRVNPRVIVGVRPCDINALNILDNILIRSNYPSPYYLARRKNTFLIGMDHEPLDDCFCESLGHDSVHRGFNMFCSDIGDKYYLTIVSSTAFNFLKGVNISDPTKEDDALYIARRKRIHESFKTKVNVAGLPSVLDIEYNSPVWTKWGDKCLNCGTCAMVCPTCYCYGTEESIDVGLRKSTKERVQYSCNLLDFAQVAGGHNFRPGTGDRLKYRFYHHYRGFEVNANNPICVGCNRCGRACLAGISPEKVIGDLQMEK